VLGSPREDSAVSVNSFGSKAQLDVSGTTYEIFRLDAVEGSQRLPFSLKVLLENLLRTEDGANITADHIRALGGWDPNAEPSHEIQFTPARVIMQDFTGVPCVVDLATMREAMRALGGDPAKINPLAPAELVIDHSVIADVFGGPDSFARNVEIEYERNRERYQFLRWGQTAFDEFKVVPPGTGIVHQVNIEYLARVVFTRDGRAYPDTLVGTDSHTTMVNGLGVLGWGVGGIEAEAAMLGQPVSMLIPRVVGFKLNGEMPEGATATDLVLTITEMLREHGVVGKFVEFYGPGVAAVPLANRATIGNMSPEYGSTAAMFPIDEETVRYLQFTGRPAEQVALVEAYAKEQGLWHDPQVEPAFSEYIELDLSTVVPSLAGPKRPQDRVALTDARDSFREALRDYVDHTATDGVDSELDESSAESFPASDPIAAGSDGQKGHPHGRATHREESRASSPTKVVLEDGTETEVDHGAVVIAAITSCTNTSNPSVMIGAALVAKKAVEKGLGRKPWVKTTLAPGSKVVMDYYERAGLTPYLEKLGFHLVGYGCTTCIGNSGPLPEPVSRAVNEADLAVVSVLSGNRNFEGRIQPDVKMNYLASPPLVVAYALAGSMDVDITSEPLGEGTDGPVYLRDLWPSNQEIQEVIDSAVAAEMFTSDYADVFAGDEQWQSLPVPTGDSFEWDPESTYVRKPPYFDGMAAEPTPVTDIEGARVLAKLGDSVTTDHISPAGAIKADSPAGRYLTEHGVQRPDFNSYGSRRGNHEVMIRGTFANIRLRNQLVPGVEGGFTRNLLAGGEQTTIYDASMAYQQAGVPLVILAGKEYGSGSSRDWAAKGTSLLGVRAVIAESYERIHRSNLIGMGVLPLQYAAGESADSLGLTGEETFAISGITALQDGSVPETVTVRADDKEFQARVRIDTPGEAAYYRNGGIMQYVLRSLLRS
jgi:aconitate hydratase